MAGSQRYHCEALFVQHFNENTLSCAHPNHTPFDETDAWRALKELCPSATLNDKNIVLSAGDMALLVLMSERV